MCLLRHHHMKRYFAQSPLLHHHIELIDSIKIKLICKDHRAAFLIVLIDDGVHCAESFNLTFPMNERRQWRNHKEWTVDVMNTVKIREETNGLARLTQSHPISSHSNTDRDSCQL
eukprot:527314_1